MPRDPAAVINRFEDIVDRRTAKFVVDADPYAAISYNATPVAIRRFEDKGGTVPTPVVTAAPKRNTRSLVRPAPVVVPELPASKKSMATQFVMIAEPKPFSWASGAIIINTPQRRETFGSVCPRGQYEAQPSKYGVVPRSRREKREQKRARQIDQQKSLLFGRVRNLDPEVWINASHRWMIHDIAKASSLAELARVEKAIRALEWESDSIRRRKTA